MTKPGSPEEGKPAEAEQVEQNAAEAPEAVTQPGDAGTPREAEGAAPAAGEVERKPAPLAEGTAAEVTGVGKEAAEEALHGADVESAEELPADASIEEQAKPKARPRRRRAGADDAAEEPKAKPAARPSADGLPVVHAHAKYVRTSARKARLVCDHIRGKSVNEARAILAHTPRAVARDWSKLLESAVANAEHNHELLGDDLRIIAVTADEGPTLKRYRPRAMGRATKIRKRTAHLSIALKAKE
jgi:ribosomal protein L22